MEFNSVQRVYVSWSIFYNGLEKLFDTQRELNICWHMKTEDELVLKYKKKTLINVLFVKLLKEGFKTNLDGFSEQGRWWCTFINFRVHSCSPLFLLLSLHMPFGTGNNKNMVNKCITKITLKQAQHKFEYVSQEREIVFTLLKSPKSHRIEHLNICRQSR